MSYSGDNRATNRSASRRPGAGAAPAPVAHPDEASLYEAALDQWNEAARAEHLGTVLVRRSRACAMVTMSIVAPAFAIVRSNDSIVDQVLIVRGALGAGVFADRPVHERPLSVSPSCSATCSAQRRTTVVDVTLR